MKRGILIILLLLVGWLVVLFVQNERTYSGQPISKAVSSIKDQPKRIALNSKIKFDNFDLKTLIRRLEDEEFKEVSTEYRIAIIEREKLKQKHRPETNKKIIQSDFFLEGDLVFERYIKIFENLLIYLVIVDVADDGSIDIYGIKRCAICM